nr:MULTISPECIES: restriction endonuclease subunit S [unclassified Micrococcus]
MTAYEPGDILLGNIRPYLKKVWQATNEGGCSGDVLAIRIKGENRAKIDSNFLYYLLSSDVFFAYNMQHAKGAKMPRGNKAAILEYRIPVPPPEIQCEIVRVLDKFTQLEVELEAELEARRAQYDYFFRDLLSFGSDEAKELTLGDIGRVAMCKRVFKSETSDNGDVPFFKIGTFGGPPDAYISRELFESYRENFSFPSRGDVLISAAGTIGRTVVYDGEEAYFQDSNIVWLDHDESIVTNAYLRHWYKVIQWATDGSTIRRLYNSNLLRARILVPPPAEQDQIVEVLDKFDALVNDISIGLPAELNARRKQYEYYRDRLLTFKEAA